MAATKKRITNQNSAPKRTKRDALKPRLIECVDRLRKLIDLNAPGVIIGAAAWHTFATTLAVCGTGAGSTMIQQIMERNLHARGVCCHEDCAAIVERPGLGMCEACQKQLGLDKDMLEVL